MKYLIFSDLHSHNYQEFSEINDGLNSRLSRCVEVVYSIAGYCLDHDIHNVFFTGDIFHLKNLVDGKVIRETMRAFQVLTQSVDQVFVCSGNHDYQGWNKDAVLLDLAADLINKIPSNKISFSDGLIDGYGLKIFPFTRDINELNSNLSVRNPEPKTIALFHQDVIGSNYGGISVINGLDADVLSAKFGFTAIGHYHSPRLIRKNVISVGSPLAHNFGDVGEKHGWWILDTETGFSFIENQDSPQFYDVDVFDSNFVLQGRPDTDYYRVKINGSSIPDAIKALKWKRVSFVSGDEEEKKKRADIKFSDDSETLILKYLTAKPHDGLDQDRLVEMGRKYL